MRDIRALLTLFLLLPVGPLSIVHCPLSIGTMHAQDKVVVTGSVQSDMLVPNEDKVTEFVKGDPEKGYMDNFMTNTYADIALQSKYVDAGLRFEFLEFPLPGYNNLANDFKGWGFPNIFIRGKLKNVEITGGSFYEQFGSGFILRTYEERSLGIDNSLLGGRVVYNPYKGIRLKALSGLQRTYWTLKKNTITGADVELNIDEWLPKMQQRGTRLLIGGSWVNKFERKEFTLVPTDPNYRYNFPRFVNAFDVRAHLQRGGFSFLAEYAHKSQDPSKENSYNYNAGNVGMISASYSKRGMSFLAQAKRSKLMSFRSQRNVPANCLAATINHLPAFTMEHTYALAALYPYATQPDGEWAYQASAAYTFKKKSALGGKYGMTTKLNFSYVHENGTTYYQDINLQLERKLTKKFKLNFMYMYQRANMTIIKREGDVGMVNSNIFVLEGKHQFNRKHTLRFEGQFLHTPDDEKDWLYALVEYSFMPHWMITVADMYNVGANNRHYYQGLVTYNIKSHRIQLGYVRNREGFNCSGGVCRRVPASKGLTLSYNYNF